MTRWKRSKRCASSCSGMPVPVSVTVSSHARLGGGDPHPDRALHRELHGVREQVEHDLGPEVAVDVHRLGKGFDLDDEAEPEALDGRLEHAGELAGVVPEVDRLEARLDPPGLQPGEVQQGVDQLEQPLPVAEDHLHPLPLPVGQRVGRFAEGVLGRPQQQRQRGAELVADVHEEVGLGLVELGELLGATLLELVGPRVGEARGDLSGDQLAEVAVAVVERAEPVEAEDLEAVGPAAGRGLEREDQRLLRRHVPRPGGQLEEPVLQVADESGPTDGHRPHPPFDRSGRLDPCRRRRVVRSEAGAAGQPGGAAVVVVQVDEGEGEVGRAAGELLAGGGDRLGLGQVGGPAGAEVTEGLHPAVRHDLLGVLLDHAEDPHDHAVVVEQRTVGEGVEALLGVAAALEEQHQRLVPRGAAGRQHRVDAGPDVVPDLRPHDRGRLAQRPRVLVAERVAPVGLVAEERQVGPPRHPHREPRGEHEAYDGLEAARPRVQRTEGGRGPVDLQQVVAHLTATPKHLPHEDPPCHQPRPRHRRGPGRCLR